MLTKMVRDNARKNRMYAVALSMASGSSIRDAARDNGVDESTVYRWRSEDDRFVSLVDQLKDRIAETAFATVVSGMPAAARKMLELLGAESEQVQLQAAKSLLEIGGDVEARELLRWMRQEFETRDAERSQGDKAGVGRAREPQTSSA
jgi:transposase-like protein